MIKSLYNYTICLSIYELLIGTTYYLLVLKTHTSTDYNTRALRKLHIILQKTLCIKSPLKHFITKKIICHV